ncbi:rifin [Plasmodium reichenowi]|uniref:Rifin n=1 Tax=Plasmodium reichenowi TaxID=5854 RepID=A0A060RQ84_PLARE|nr:rifin [Plasmodium reichenowi]
MNLHCSKILLFVIPLNILVTLYHVYSKNKPYITTHHTPIYISRVLSEGDTRSSIYDKDEEMKSVKENFYRKTSQIFQEYEERMKDKRQKHKEQRDKNIQKIIEKDKMDKSLTEKIEKGCLRCGCALGGGVLPVWGLVSGLWYATLSQHVTKVAIQKGIEEGLKVGLDVVIKIADPSSVVQGAKIPTVEMLQPWTTGISSDNVTLYGIFECINNNIKGPLLDTHQPFFTTVKRMVEKTFPVFNSEYNQQATAVASAVEEGKALKAAEFAAKTGLLSNTIIASVVTILVIVLVMIIIYLILRYRRKEKMKKKAEYTKLLKE